MNGENIMKTKMKLYNVSMRVDTYLPRGREHYLIRKLILHVLRKGQYDGYTFVNPDDDSRRILRYEEFYLNRFENILWTLLVKKELLQIVDNQLKGGC